ncbi:MAG: hypothetical protein JJE51_13550 [Thermoanaerobaculia bacterium]|nr:hypothetical protein [Thermoanaerobaculia bacterium]
MRTTGNRYALLFLAIVIALPLVAAPLGTSDMNAAGLSLDLNSVERKGNVLTVKWAVKNSGAENARVNFGLSGRLITTYLVDEENGTKYYSLTDKEGNNLASEHVYIGSDTFGIEDYLKAGETKKYWGKFPAPPPAVKSINIILTDAEPFEGIVITEKK